MNNNNNPEEDPKIIDMAAARKRQKTLRKADAKKSGNGFKIAGYSIWNWAQLALFLAVISFLAQQCHS